MNAQPAPEQPMHSMSQRDRQLALNVLSAAWARLAQAPPNDVPLEQVVRAVAAALPEHDLSVDAAYARYAAEAALWYLDRAVRRVADADRNGRTAELRGQNLNWFTSTASRADLERLFALAVGLNADNA